MFRQRNCEVQCQILTKQSSLSQNMASNEKQAEATIINKKFETNSAFLSISKYCIKQKNNH